MIFNFIIDIVPYAQVFAYLAAGGSLIFSAFTYYKNNKVKRGEWLKALFEKFFEGDKFSEVRKQIEYESLNTFLAVDSKGMCTDKDNEEKLVNYLNFFELIAILRNSGHIEKEEVKNMFGYFIKAIKKDKFILSYIGQFDFENLEKLLKEYE
jgi:hypothetical protein